MLALFVLSSAVSSSIARGNFWRGVQHRVIISGLNHAMHSMAEDDDDVRINTKNKTAKVTRTGDGHERIFVDGVEVMTT